jgi:hypothetical protein
LRRSFGSGLVAIYTKIALEKAEPKLFSSKKKNNNKKKKQKLLNRYFRNPSEAGRKSGFKGSQSFFSLHLDWFKLVSQELNWALLKTRSCHA